MSCLLIVNASSIRRQVIDITWAPPTELMVKLNVDGASRGDPGHAGCGCAIRNHEGRWLIGAAQNLGICSAYQAKLRVALVGLRLAWKQGFRRVIMETDSSTVHLLLTGSNLAASEVNVLVSECKTLLNMAWTVEVKRVYREANYIADGVANWALTQCIGHHLLTDPPMAIRHSLLADVAGVSRPRYVSNTTVGM